MQREWRPFAGLGKVLAVAIAIFLTLSVGSIHAQQGGGQFNDPNTLWFRAYQLLQEGLKSEEAGRDLDALAKFNESKPLFDGLARDR